MSRASKKKIKILLVEICNRNLGDTVIADNVEYLLKKAFPFYMRKDVDILTYNIYSDDVGQIKYVDAVIFDGGGIIKYKAEHFYEKIINITSQAQKYNVPVFFNAVGIEGYDETDTRCTDMKKAINLPCVKAISVRDDINTLAESYITNSNIEISSVFDSAVFSSKVYKQIKHNKSSDVIGLGVARDALFADHGIEEIDREYLLNFWKDVALELQNRGLKWKIFTNGTDADEKFAQEVLNLIKSDPDITCEAKKVSKITESAQLVKTICSFKGVIACRMHTNIIAYSYKIPSVGLVWNDKLKFWGEKIGYPERFISKENLNAKYTVDMLEQAIEQGCRGLTKKQRNTSFAELKKFTKKYCTPKNGRKYEKEFEDHLLAPALGTLHLKYKNMNYLAMFEESLKKGFKAVETDVRLTKDGKPVLVNGWNGTTYKMLSADADKYKSSGMTYKNFKKARWFENYCTSSFENFIKEYVRLKSQYEFNMILDIGRPSVQKFDLLITSMNEIMSKYGVKPNDFIIRVQRQSDVESLKRLNFNAEIMYYLPAEDENFDMSVSQTAQYCVDNSIKRISMRPKAYTDENAAVLNSFNLKACIFSLTKLDDILECTEKGAEFAGSYVYSPEYFKKLTK